MNNQSILNLFDGEFTDTEIVNTCLSVGLWPTDCLSDETPHYTVAVEEEGEPVWQLNQLANGRFLLAWFDAGYLPTRQETIDRLASNAAQYLQGERKQVHDGQWTGYDLDLAGKSPKTVADAIKVWRNDEGALYGAACDLLNSIEPWLRELSVRGVAEVPKSFQESKSIIGELP